MKALLTTILLVFFAVGVAHAETKGRIMTNGKVSLYKNGKVVNSFTEQGPIDENSLIACDGTCLVKIRGVSLIAKDRTRFAIKELPGSINLYVETGTVNFAASDTSKQFSFYTPIGFVKTEGFITSASNDKSVKGFLESNEKGSAIGMDKGSMVIQTSEGVQTIKEGQVFILAQLPDADKNDDDDDDDKGAVIIPGSGAAAENTVTGGGITLGGITFGTDSLLAGSLALAGLGAVAINEGAKDETSAPPEQSGPETPGPVPPGSPSPNQ